MSADYQRLLEVAPDAVVVVAADGRIVWSNLEAEVLFGWTREELSGRPIEVLVPPRYRPGHPTFRSGFFAEASSRLGLTVAAIRRDGTEIDLDVALSPPVASPLGPLVVATARDVSHRKRGDEMKARAAALEAENVRIQEASRLKSEFLATMSHELRTPLNAILGFAELLHDGHIPPDAPEHREYLGDILTSGRHLAELINDVLDLSKVEAGKLEFVPQRIEVQDIVREVSAIIRPAVDEKRLRLDNMIEPNLQVILDPVRLRQVLYNFVSNAVKFAPEGGWVRITARGQDGTRFRLEVEDSGPGISPGDRDRLFSEFVKLGTTQAKGTGLALALAKKLVEAQGGSVGVKEATGGGTIFFAVLPRRARRSTRDL